MNTTEVAEHLGTTPRVLRQFLRSPLSTFVAVGSGERYEFRDQDLPTLVKRFADWQGAGKPKPTGTKVKATAPSRKPTQEDQIERDLREWQEEGDVKIPDIRNPRVRARVLADARAAEDRLTLMLLAKGMHISQLGDRTSA